MKLFQNSALFSYKVWEKFQLVWCFLKKFDESLGKVSISFDQMLGLLFLIPFMEITIWE